MVMVSHESHVTLLVDKLQQFRLGWVVTHHSHGPAELLGGDEVVAVPVALIEGLPQLGQLLLVEEVPLVPHDDLD